MPLPAVSIFICGIDDSEEFANLNLGGVGGYAWPNQVLLFMNPSRHWEDLLFKTALHKLNHCQRYRWSDPYHSFLEWLVFEGLAQEFAAQVNGDSSNSFDDNDTIARQYLTRIKSFWDTNPADDMDWFFGNEAKNLPFALGYKVGHLLVRQFLTSHPAVAWPELIKIPSRDLSSSCP